MVIIEHLGGATAFFGKKSNPQHRSFGKIVVTVGRIVACVGWILAGNLQNAIIVAVASLVITIIALALPSKPNNVISTENTERSRSKSPRAKR